MKQNLNKMLLGLAMSFLITLSACSTKYITVTKEVLVVPPDSLLNSPCTAIGAGRTVQTLSNGYIVNTSCVYKNEAQWESIREWKKQQQLIYKDK